MSRRSNTKEFIAKAEQVHGDTYNYDQTVYTNSDTAVIILCHKHGLFRQIPYNHLGGRICKQCANEEQALKAALTTQEFVARARRKHGDHFDYSKTEYKNSDTPVTIFCRIHRVWFSQIAYNHLIGKLGCTECRTNYHPPNEEIIRRFQAIHTEYGHHYDYDLCTFSNNKDRLYITCCLHGPFTVSFFRHRKGTGCPECTNNFHSTAAKHFVRRARVVHGKKYAYGQYFGAAEKMRIVCPVHGEFSQSPASHLQGHGWIRATADRPCGATEPAGTIWTFCKYSHTLAVSFTPPTRIIPIMMAGQDLLNARGNRAVDDVMGHLKPGIGPLEAAADLNSIGSWMRKTYPQTESQAKFSLGPPGIGDLFGGAIRAFLGGLVLLAALILLAACANLGSLFTARAADRSREIAVRLALGARRLRVVRQLLTEALLISIIGGAAGLWGSVMLLEWLSGWQPFPEFPMYVPVTPDNHVYGIALLLAIASGFLFGAAPIRQVLDADPYGIVKSGSWSTPERRVTVHDLLLGVQIAICAVLVTSSMVAVRGMLRSLDSHLGIDPRSAMLVRIDPTLAGYQGDGVPEMQQRTIDAVEAIPGVTSVGLVGEYPPLHIRLSKVYSHCREWHSGQCPFEDRRSHEAIPCYVPVPTRYAPGVFG